MDFEYLGSHCHVAKCNRKDFLPFVCDGCRGSFCINHRCYKAHLCKFVPKGRQVIGCPLCGKGIDIERDELADYLWNQHYTSGGCKKESFEIKCANSECKVKMNYCNFVVCEKCNKNVCIQHRFSDQHECLAESRWGCFIF